MFILKKKSNHFHCLFYYFISLNFGPSFFAIFLFSYNKISYIFNALLWIMILIYTWQIHFIYKILLTSDSNLLDYLLLNHLIKKKLNNKGLKIWLILWYKNFLKWIWLYIQYKPFFNSCNSSYYTSLFYSLNSSVHLLRYAPSNVDSSYSIV